jgi:hypothetical protein
MAWGGRRILSFNDFKISVAQHFDGDDAHKIDLRPLLS